MEAVTFKRHGMPRSPHKKGGYRPFRQNLVHGKFAATGGHSGSVPEGKVSKGKRFSTQPAGYPQGRHVGGDKTCFCGGCFTKNKHLWTGK